MTNSNLVDVVGVVDIRDGHALVRTGGYLPGPDDASLTSADLQRHGLRPGDLVTGTARRERRLRLDHLDTVNGLDPRDAKHRPEFYRLTPVHPQQPLRLETEPHRLLTRVVDLVMPIGKGQRALIVSPPKAGKTVILQAVADAVARNNPECHLMALLVDERPEEVTDMQRTVKGEVAASTFDRPPRDHTALAELAIERAKRLAELGEDVVVLLDSITRLGRAYNLAAPPSGRILTGGIESAALSLPKRLLGAARNLEGSGSLTIIATALVETGSVGDNVLFEEYKSTGNAELRLDRRLADRRIFPAVEIATSGTRKEELLLPPEELVLTRRLRRALQALEPPQALQQLLDQLRRTTSNVEFLVQLGKLSRL